MIDKKRRSKTNIKEQALPSADNFPIVGIGASAGGLAAFEAFFSGMPSDKEPGMAFILVQHLAPDHKSILTELIRRYTKMKVFEVKDGMKVSVNCAYIIPPNRDMAFLNGNLELLEPANPRGQRLPIDFFFRSLAFDQHERAIGIILSGTGSDGTLGIRAIKGEGGMAMAQNPDSTEFDAMPRNSIATGLIDYVLPPAEMPKELIAYTSRAFGKLQRISQDSPVKRDSEHLNKIFILLRSQTGHDFSKYKPNTINRRIERRMAINRIERLEEYIRYLQQNSAEVTALFKDMLIGVTSFFRDTEIFSVLEEQVIKRLFENKKQGAALRVWVPACSTGEEAYSIAILLQEHIDSLRKNFTIQIFATDIDNGAIEQARQGIYPASIASDVTQERLSRFFTKDSQANTYRINKSIRDLIVFSEQDVIKDPPFSRLDLISCRNLLIYLGADLQKKLIPLFHYALNPDGFLFMGSSETVGEHIDLFESFERKAKIYKRKSDITCRSFSIFPVTMNINKRDSAAENLLSLPGKTEFKELTEQAMLKHYSSAGLLVNLKGDILYLHGRTGLYLEPAPGESDMNILKMAREGLRHKLTIALQKAVTSKEPVSCPDVKIKTNGNYTIVNLSIHPVKANLFLIILKEEINPIEKQVKVKPVKNNETISVLKQELQAKEEFLQTTVEELKSSNEELQSVNEELQSTNEELETSKEELQSINEELVTVNAELQIKVSDLSRINNDMNNLISGTGIGTIFVDHKLHILRFTNAVTQVINLIPTDVGRPVQHIVSNLEGYNRLIQDVREVLDTLIPKEIEVKTLTGTWFLMRIQPYRTTENVIEGAVITFVNITLMKQAKEFAEGIVNTIREPLLIMDSGLKVVSANQTFYDFFKETEANTIGKHIYSLCNGELNFPKLRELLEDILPKQSRFKDYEVTIGKRAVILNAREIKHTAGKERLILLAMEEVKREGIKE